MSKETTVVKRSLLIVGSMPVLGMFELCSATTFPFIKNMAVLVEYIISRVTGRWVTGKLVVVVVAAKTALCLVTVWKKPEDAGLALKYTPAVTEEVALTAFWAMFEKPIRTS